jgi:hypothetical protein
MVFIILLTSCSDSSKFTIEGIVERANQKKIYLDEQEVETALPVDSARINKDGSFRFKGECDYPKFYNLHLQDNKILPLLVAPGDKVYIKTSLETFGKNYDLEGSEGSVYIKLLNEHLADTKRKLDSIKVIFSSPSVTKEKQTELGAE